MSGDKSIIEAVRWGTTWLRGAELRPERRSRKRRLRRALIGELLESRRLLAADFGDAPLPFPSVLADDGASHVAVGPTLGALRDMEEDGSNSDDALGDGADEDGVLLNAAWRVGQLDAAVTVNVQQAPDGARLDAWVDFNQDRNWGGPEERIFFGEDVVEGDNLLSFPVPASAASGDTFARFRLSTAGELGPQGAADDGEVEDYRVSIQPPEATIGKFNIHDVTSAIPTPTSPWSVETADVDGDGDLDVLSASVDDNEITWYENDGQQRFTGHVITSSAGYALSVEAADLDADGDMDVLSASRDDNTVAWYENDGQQNFTVHKISTSATGAAQVVAADLDSDGDLDVLAPSRYDNRLGWYQNDGHQHFTRYPVDIDIIASDTVSVYVADIDGDGHLDVLSASYHLDQIVWHRNDGQQNFERRVIANDANGASSVFAADLDGDGDTDVLSASIADQKIAWYENLNGIFSPHVLSPSAQGASDVFAADLDGDGDLDVLSASALDDMIAWFRNDGGGEFSPPNTITSQAQFALDVTAADLDGDGDLDVLSASSLDGTVAWYENQGQNTANPTFTLHVVSTSSARPLRIHTADLDADGDEDVFSAEWNAGRLVWYENQDGQFTRFEFPVEVEQPGAITTSDLDNDGDLDLIATSGGDDRVLWLENQGGKNFTARLVNDETHAPRGVLAVDMDADGDSDIVSASESDNRVVWYENRLDENIDRFELHQIGFVSDAYEVAAADLNDDGTIDVIAGGGGQRELTVFYNLGELFGFQAEIIATSDTGYSLVWIADVSGDGRPDVLSASWVGNRVSWHENLGDHQFAEHLVSQDAIRPSSISAADIDSDGDPDLLASTYGNDTVSLFENLGFGVFSDPHNVTRGAEGAATSVASDLDHDGDVDILAGSLTDDTVAWYENDGQQLFAGHTITSATRGAFNVRAADFDGDGDVDLVSASFVSNELIWYENDARMFTPHTITTADGLLGVEALDMDGDGDVDLLTAAVFDNDVAWYENDGQANFTRRLVDGLAEGAAHAYGADLDGDGDLDIVAGIFFEDSIVWYENDGSQNFTRRTIYPFADGPTAVSVADLDGDGHLDVLSSSWNDASINWYRNNGSQQFNRNTISNNMHGAGDVRVADFNGDGHLDVLATAESDNKIVWFENDGQGVFRDHGIAFSALRAFSAAAADVDGDGDVDVLAASFGDDTIAWCENDGSGQFVVRPLTRVAGGAANVVAADIDGDGDLDLVSSASYDNRIAWYENADAPQVVAVAMNLDLSDPPDLPSGPKPTSWTKQRSEVRTIDVTFSEPVLVAAQDLLLTNLGLNAPADPDELVPITDDQLFLEGNRLSIHFPSGTLNDGVYQLDIAATVTDLEGVFLDGNGDGIGGDDFRLVGDDTNQLYKLIGDWNGDQGVTIFDFSTFAYWFGQSMAPDYVDLNQDGGVTIFDFPLFAEKFGAGIVYPTQMASTSLAAAFLSVSTDVIRSPRSVDFRFASEPPVAPKSGREFGFAGNVARDRRGFVRQAHSLNRLAVAAAQDLRVGSFGVVRLLPPVESFPWDTDLVVASFVAGEGGAIGDVFHHTAANASPRATEPYRQRGAE